MFIIIHNYPGTSHEKTNRIFYLCVLKVLSWLVIADSNLNTDRQFLPDYYEHYDDIGSIFFN